jgi:MerR family transcriptional regulator, light-induced transcriptional regulator
MANWNEHSIQAVFDPDQSALSAYPPGPRVPDPIWRYRPPVKGAGVALSLHTLVPPRAVSVHRPMSQPSPPASTDRGAPFEVQQFTFLVLGSDDSAALAYVDSLTSQGTSTDLIFLNLLAPAARLLGEMWEADTTDFANVTLGVSRLHRILRHLGENDPDGDRATTSGTILLTTIPGEQHSFGMAMAAEFFRRDGWDICTGPFASQRELSLLVQERWFDVVGFSVTSDRRLDELKRGIHDVRRDSRNRRVGIVLGGPMTMQRPELAGLLGADSISTDGARAPQLARDLVALMKSRT